jgi:hypothetical protein
MGQKKKRGPMNQARARSTGARLFERRGFARLLFVHSSRFPPTHTHTHTHTHTNIHKQICMYADLRVPLIHARTHTHTHNYTHTD